jgi:hypothetical protein
MGTGAICHKMNLGNAANPVAFGCLIVPDALPALAFKQPNALAASRIKKGI